LPEGTTIAHGFLTLSLVSALARQALTIAPIRMAVNYGVNRVRFMSPVPAGSRIRGRFTLAAVADAGGGVQVTWSVTVEREHGGKPCCVAEWLVRYYPSEAGTSMDKD
jgi:acyl dehydratase